MHIVHVSTVVGVEPTGETSEDPLWRRFELAGHPTKVFELLSGNATRHRILDPMPIKGRLRPIHACIVKMAQVDLYFLGNPELIEMCHELCHSRGGRQGGHGTRYILGAHGPQTGPLGSDWPGGERGIELSQGRVPAAHGQEIPRNPALGGSRPTGGKKSS